MIRDLKITLPYITKVDTSEVTKWVLVDAQPHHHKSLGNIDFTIIIDHHPPDPALISLLRIFVRITARFHQ